MIKKFPKIAQTKQELKEQVWEAQQIIEFGFHLGKYTPLEERLIAKGIIRILWRYLVVHRLRKIKSFFI